MGRVAIFTDAEEHLHVEVDIFEPRVVRHAELDLGDEILKIVLGRTPKL